MNYLCKSIYIFYLVTQKRYQWDILKTLNKKKVSGIKICFSITQGYIYNILPKIISLQCNVKLFLRLAISLTISLMLFLFLSMFIRFLLLCRTLPLTQHFKSINIYYFTISANQESGCDQFLLKATTKVLSRTGLLYTGLTGDGSFSKLMQAVSRIPLVVAGLRSQLPSGCCPRLSEFLQVSCSSFTMGSSPQTLSHRGNLCLQSQQRRKFFSLNLLVKWGLVTCNYGSNLLQCLPYSGGQKEVTDHVYTQGEGIMQRHEHHRQGHFGVILGSVHQSCELSSAII